MASTSTKQVKLDSSIIAAPNKVLTVDGLPVARFTSNILGSPVATITIPVPAGYSSFKLSIQGRSDAATSSVELYVQPNGDSGTNYTTIAIFTTQNSAPVVSSAASTGLTVMKLGDLTAATSPTNEAGFLFTVCNNYSGTTFFKQFNSQGCSNAFTGFASYELFAGFWASTVAITSLVLSISSGNFVVGTFWSLECS